MKLRTAALGLVALLTATGSVAGMVTTSSNMDLLAIDGQKASKSLLKEKRSFNIDDTATHQVVVRVTDIVGSGSNQGLFESDPIIVTFQGTTEDVVISAPSIRTKGQGEKYRANPTLNITTASGQAVAAKVDVLKQEGLFPNANVVADLADYNASDAVAAVPAFAAATAAAAMPAQAAALPVAAPAEKPTKGKVTVQGQNVAEQQLQYWFQQADKATQTRFLNWAKSQK